MVVSINGGKIKLNIVNKVLTGDSEFSGEENAKFSKYRVCLPEGIETVDSRVFHNKKCLKEIIFPAGIKVIKSEAVSRCESLARIELNAEVEVIESGAFSFLPNLKEIVIRGENAKYQVVNGCLIEKESGALLSCTCNAVIPLEAGIRKLCLGALPKTMKKVVLPNTLLFVEDYAFGEEYEYNLNEYENGLYLPSESNPYFLLCGIKDKKASVFRMHKDTRIVLDRVFSVNTHLTEAYLSRGIRYIPPYLFEQCTRLRRVAFLQEGELNATPSPLFGVGNGAFLLCTSLKEVELPLGLTYVDDNAFRFCVSLENLCLPSSVERIGGWAFDSCKKMEKVELPSSLRFIEAGAFISCRFTSITIPEGVEEVSWCAFEMCKRLSFVGLPSSLRHIGWGAFSGCKALKEIHLPSSLRSIAYNAFSDSGLQKILLPASLEKIEEKAFAYCSRLKEIAIQGESARFAVVDGCLVDTQTGTVLRGTRFAVPNGITHIGAHAYSDIGRKGELLLPEGIVSVGEYAFDGCANLTVTLPNTLRYVGRYAFYGISQNAYSYYRNALYLPSASTPYFALAQMVDKAKRSLSIHEDAAFILNGAIEDSKLEKLSLPAKVRQIGANNLQYLRSFTTASQSVLERVGEGVLKAGSLKRISLPPTILDIGNNPLKKTQAAFRYFDGAYYIGNKQYPYSVLVGIKKIGKRHYTIPAQTKVIAESAFYGSNVRSVTFEEGSALRLVQRTAFAYCIYLSNLALPSGLECIERAAFSYCRVLSSLRLPASLQVVKGFAFENSGLIDVLFEGDSLEYLGENVFGDCLYLRNVQLPKTIQETGVSVYAWCPSLEKISLPKIYENKFNDLFYECDNLKDISFYNC